MAAGAGRPQMAQLIERCRTTTAWTCCAGCRAVRREPVAAGGRGRSPRHRHAVPPGREHRRRRHDDRLRLAAAELDDRPRRSNGCACQAPDRETIYYIYVLDEPIAADARHHRRLRALILSRPARPIRDVMLSNDIVTVRATDDREKAAETARQVRLARDSRARRRRPAWSASSRTTTSSTSSRKKRPRICRSKAPSDHSAATILKRGRSRSGGSGRSGSVCCLCAELMTFTVMAGFEQALEAILVLSLFVPLCISTGGNSGFAGSDDHHARTCPGPHQHSRLVACPEARSLDGAVAWRHVGHDRLFPGAATSEDLRSAERA